MTGSASAIAAAIQQDHLYAESSLNSLDTLDVPITHSHHTTASIAINITPVNDAPVTTPVTLAAIAEDSGARLITQAELLANASDVDGPSLYGDQPADLAGSGSLVDNGDGTWSYHPALNDDSSVTFSYSGDRRGCAGGDHCNARHHAGERRAGDDAGDAGGDRGGQRGAADHAGRASRQRLRRRRSVAATAINLPICAGSGSLVDNGDGTWSYHPALNDDTSVTFSYAVTDGIATVATTATLDITPVNDVPMTTPVTLAAIAEDSGARLITQAELLANASDVDGPSLLTAINLGSALAAARLSTTATAPGAITLRLMTTAR